MVVGIGSCSYCGCYNQCFYLISFWRKRMHCKNLSFTCYTLYLGTNILKMLLRKGAAVKTKRKTTLEYWDYGFIDSFGRWRLGTFGNRNIMKDGRTTRYVVGSSTVYLGFLPCNQCYCFHIYNLVSMLECVLGAVCG